MDEKKLLIPLNSNDLAVLSWYAEWTPAVHKADWLVRRSWPPGFRYMEDLSLPGWSDRHDTIANAEAKMCAGPILPGDTEGKRKVAAGRLKHLVSYRLLEGVWFRGTARITARGRAALKFYGKWCPEEFESHAPEIFPNHSLLPLNGKNTHKLVNLEYQASIPDTKEWWRLLLVEYTQDGYFSVRGLSSGTARLSTTSTTGTYLEGSLREHHKTVLLSVNDAASGATVLEMEMPLEGLAELITSTSEVPVTLNHFFGPDGMAYSRPSAPPLSVSKRMKIRVSDASAHLLERIASIKKVVEEASMGKKVQKDILSDLEILARDIPTHGGFAATQAMEELSTVAESLMVVMSERVTGGETAFAALTGKSNASEILMLTGGESDHD